MKKFVYLALLALVTVVVGCNKETAPADTTTTPPSTNPPAAK